MNAKELFNDLPVTLPESPPAVSGIHTDTRDLRPGDLFVARSGGSTDGHRFLQQAAEAGATAGLVDPGRIQEPPSDLPLIRTDRPEELLTPLLKRFYGDPSEELTLVGVTGTNGKTTTTRLIATVLEEAGHPTAVFGTVVHEFRETSWEYDRTTPSRVELYRGLSEARRQGASAAVLEVSSHALDQGRVDGLRFDSGAFTNLTQDHLDYHASMEEYFEAKSKLFEQVEEGVARLDEYGKRLARMDHVAGLGEPGDEATYVVADHDSDLEGSSLILRIPRDGQLELESRLTGSYNIWNMALAAAVADQLGVEPEAIRRGIRSSRQVPGRCERIEGPPDVIVDYAHTPDALRNVLGGLRTLVDGRLICVFGAGGDRDRTKRPRMGRAVETEADYAVVTSDNPRSEDPERIIDDILEGFEGSKYQVQPDRGQAIREAVEWAEDDDVIVVAGKGHETGIEFADITVPFDDAVVVREVLNSRDDG